MYTNTIYILNKIILECFDIDFKGKNKKKNCDFIKEEQKATCL